jgi:hypothetical protein
LQIIIIRHHSGRKNMMNPLHKSLTTAFLAVSIFTLGPNVDLIGAQDTAAGQAASRRLTDPLKSRYIKFDRLTIKDGLSSDQTWELVQDKPGFIWFRTANGPSRYDGASAKVCRNEPDNPNSLTHNFVRALIADKSGDLWVGTWFGVLMVIVLELGLIKPPVGLNVFVLKAAAPDVPQTTIFRGIWPFLNAALLAIVIITAFPQIALFIPSLM